MATTLADINTLVNDRRRDTTTNSIDMSTVGFRAINSVLQIWNEVHDWPWTIKTVNFNYNPGIYTYTVASDFKFPLTLQPFKPNTGQGNYTLVSPLKFPTSLYSQRFAVSNVAGVQYLMVKSLDGNNATLNAATAYNENGTWAGATAISNVSTNDYEGYTWPSSVSFDYTGTSGTLTNSTMTAVDLTAFQNRSNLYVDIYFPTVTSITSVALKWGTDSSNYYTVTSTTDYIGRAFAVGWNRVKFAWSSPTTVGTPTITSIAYLQMTLAYSVSPAATGFYFQNVFISENVPVTLTYYSTNMVYDVSGAAQLQLFNDSAATTDYPLWSGRWDIATEPFVNSVLEIIFSITGEYTDMNVARQKIIEIATPLKQRYPSQRRYPTLQFSTDTNFGRGSGDWGNGGNAFNNI